MKRILALLLALIMVIVTFASCDIGGNTCSHIDEVADHLCDKCGASMGVHADKANDGDHRCDQCKAVMSLCEDTNKDHKCDECGAVTDEHFDNANDGDHLCEYCNQTVSGCWDSNKDGYCDECGKKINTGMNSDNNTDNNTNDNQNNDQDIQIPESFDTTTPITITFYHTMGQNLRDVLDRYIVEFNELYPNITVKHEQVGGYDDVRDQIKTEIAVGGQPNIAYCYPDHVALYNLAKATASLDNLISSTMTVKRADGTTETLGLTQSQIDDFIEGFYNEGKAFGDGKMYSMPLSKSTEVLYYNKTFFDKHNLKVPKTWDEMEAVCAKIKEIDPDCIPLGYDSESNWFITMCEQMNSPYTSATGDYFLFNNETNRNFVKKFREWYQKGYVTTQEISGGYTSGLFTKSENEAGKSYMSIASSAGATHQRPTWVNGEYPFEVGIATVPQVDPANPKVISQGPSLCIFNKSNSQEVLASWLFVKFLTTNVEFQAEFSMVSGYLPVIKSTKNHLIYKTHFLDKANGGDNITALAAKVGLEQENAYFVSPAFNGSSAARNQVGTLMQKCFTSNTNYVDKMISDNFAEAIDECIYQMGENYSQINTLNSATNYLYLLYSDTVDKNHKDYDVISTLTIGNNSYNVNWTVEVTNGDPNSITVKNSTNKGFYTIDIDETTENDIFYILNATLSDENGNTSQTSFYCKVRARNLYTYNEYILAKDETWISVRGIIAGIMAKSDGDKENSLFLQDLNNEGGFYIYGLEKDPITELNLKVGMTVEADGNKTNYNGTHELKNTQITVIDSSIKDVIPVDYTEIFKAAEKTDDANLVAKQALLVTIKGVEVTDQDIGNGYYKFKLDGVESYVRISSSSNCTTKAEAETMKANHTAKKGYTADVTGIVQIYNGAFYLIPVSADAFSNFVLGGKTLAEQITYEIGKLAIPAEVAYNKDLTLPLKGVYFAGVTLSYAVTGNCLAYDAATGKLTVNAEATDKKGTITVTATAEGATAVTEIFEITIVEPSNIFDVLQKADGEEVTVKGIVINVKEAWNDQYGNMSYTIMDDAGRALYIYRTRLQAEVGDFVTVTGKMATYGGARQIGQGSTGEKGTADG